MKSVTWVLLALLGSSFIAGCSAGEVTSEDAKAYQNAGRDADDPVIDPNTGQPVESK